MCIRDRSKRYTECSLAKIGREVKRDHGTVINGLKIFKNIYKTNSYMANKEYQEVNMRLRRIQVPKDDFDVLNCKDLNKVIQYYRIKQYDHIEQYHKVINNYEEKLKTLYENFKHLNLETYKEISELEPEEFEDLNSRIELFLKVNRKLKKA